MRSVVLVLGTVALSLTAACGGEQAPAKDPSAMTGTAPATTASAAPATAAPATAAPAAPTAAAKSDIVDTAVAAGQFSTLAAALKAADLVDTLKGSGPFTVFAPTDEAFKKLPAGTVESLLKPENKAKLQSILKYHVVPGKVMAAQALKLTSAKTVQGGDAKLSVSGTTLSIDAAKVVKADIECSNGVIHVIDTVIMPAK